MTLRERIAKTWRAWSGGENVFAALPLIGALAIVVAIVWGAALKVRHVDALKEATDRSTIFAASKECRGRVEVDTAGNTFGFTARATMRQAEPSTALSA